MERRVFLSALGALCAAGRPVRRRRLPRRQRFMPLVDRRRRDAVSLRDDGRCLSPLRDRRRLAARHERLSGCGRVVGGAFELGKSSITSLCAAHVRGVPLVAIAPGGEYDINLPAQIGLIVRADGPLKTGADLDGKTMGVSALNDFFSLASRA